MKKDQYQWNLGLLYKGDTDPQIEADMHSIEKACTDFEKKYRTKDFISSPAALFAALQDSTKLQEKMLGHKPWWYFALSAHMNADNTLAAALSTTFEQRLSIAANKTTFFSLKIATIPKNKQKEFLSYAPLAPFSYLLKKIFEGAKYNLSEKEENLATLLAQSSYTMWVQGQEKLLFQQSVSHNGKNIPLSEARELLSGLPTRERRALYGQITKCWKTISQHAETEMNAICNYKKTIDEQRGYKQAYSSTLLGNDNDERSIEVLADIVTKNFPISQRFYALHAKLLKQKSITPADLNVPVGVIGQTFSFEKTVEIVRNGFKKIGPEYVACLDQFIERGQIDVYPRKGKMGGGYCWQIGPNPTYILLNHVDTIRSVETLAHEMGHGFHNEFSRVQPPHYQEHSTSTAEVASTFFEQLIIDDLEQVLSEKERIVLLHNKINGDIMSIFVQIACFNFERELHVKIRQEGKLSKEQMADLMNKHMSACWGPTVTTNEADGYRYVGWPHIRMFFYTYTYAFGQLISRSMFEKWKENPSFESKVRAFLVAGGSMSPKDIFKKMGINIADPTFFEAGLRAIESDIKKLEKLAKKAGMLS